jgi:hypothetical protein
VAPSKGEKYILTPLLLVLAAEDLSLIIKIVFLLLT